MPLDKEIVFREGSQTHTLQGINSAIDGANSAAAQALTDSKDFTTQQLTQTVSSLQEYADASSSQAQKAAKDDATVLVNQVADNRIAPLETAAQSLQQRLSSAESTITVNGNKITTNSQNIQTLQNTAAELSQDLTAQALCAQSSRDYDPAQNTCVNRPNPGEDHKRWSKLLLQDPSVHTFFFSHHIFKRRQSSGLHYMFFCQHGAAPGQLPGFLR